MASLHKTLLIADEPNQAFSSTAFNYAVTFKFMNRRRLQRQSQGVYPGPSKLMNVISQLVWYYAAFVVIVIGSASSSSKKVTLQMAALVFVVLYVVGQLRSRLVHLIVYCAVAAHATFYAIAGDVGLFEVSNRSTRRSEALIFMGIAEALVVVMYTAIYYIYPTVINREWVDPIKWFEVQRGRRANTITYRTTTVHNFWPQQREFTIQYTGGHDGSFRPHGFGVWRDTSYHGETLAGSWEHGIPVGPFTTREHGSGYASQQIRIAYAAYRNETDPASRDTAPKFPVDKTLRWGVASMECSVAGGFFTFLPKVEYFFDRGNAPPSARQCVKTLRTPLDSVFYRDTETHEIVSACATKYHENLEPTTLTTNEKEQAPTRDKEALVFIHGIDNSVEDAIKICGQLLARGDFPSEIHPFVFSWPSGNFPVPSYWAAKRNAESEEVASALHTMVTSLRDAEYTKVNFITHSMGTRVFLNTIERNTFKDVFRNGISDHVLSIGSITLCSPEFPLDRFVAGGGTFDVLREYCGLVTIYGDRWDLALRGSEFANRDAKQCSSRVRSLGSNVYSVVRDPSFPASTNCHYVSARGFHASETTSSAAAMTVVNRNAGFNHVAGIAVSENVPDEIELTDGAAPSSYGAVSEYSDRDGDRTDAKPRMYLDVDVINTSFTDSNVGHDRHSYFRVNESIVEDIRELVLHKRRARGRAGLMRQRGNAFVFLTAPKDIL